ncbi:MAG: hypothetical protein HFH68_09375 [Lachnospiraceae bacterium]|nr:hypothetical protein [Lachnospiraceae bacterium]
MERIKCLDSYQRGVLLIVTIMVVVFTIVYPVIFARKGFAYKGEILIPEQENNNTIYSGKIQGEQAIFTVYADKTVEFQYGSRTYGPYTAKEDPAAIPEGMETREAMTGVELRCGEEIIFRGGVLDDGNYHFLYNEDGNLEDIGEVFSVTVSNGIVMDENGNIIDQMEPSVSSLLDLMAGPNLAHKGNWFAWFGGVFFCVATAISILFADELFHLRLAFSIRDAGQAEPSDWEIAGRYITWTLLPGIAMVLFIMGIQ